MLATLRRYLRHVHNPYIAALCAVIILGAFLRLYNFKGFVTYLGDQGRDTIVMRRIVTLEHFPGIGASSSVGDLFLGPFYYYLVSPWLLLTDFDPVGPALAVAIFSILCIPAIYVVGADLFSKRVGLISAFLVATAYSMVWLSRFSWNPNLLPLSALLCFYFFMRAISERGRILDYFFVGALMAISTQFHYVSLAMGLPIALIFVCRTAVHRKKLRKSVMGLLSMIAGFIIFHAPMILFELRNNFLNTRGLIELFTAPHESGRSFIQELLYTLNEVSFHALQYRTVDDLAAVVIIMLIGVLVVLRKPQHRPLQLTVFFFLTMLVATSIFTESKNRHYFGALFPFVYLLVGYLLAHMWERKLGLVTVAVVCVFLFMQKDLEEFFSSPGPDLIGRAEHISQVIYDNHTGESLQITSLPDHYGDYMYRYYLEVWGRRPVERASLIRADELFVVCNEPCTPIGDPQWDIAYFQPTRIVGEWDVEDVTIYKLESDAPEGSS